MTMRDLLIVEDDATLARRLQRSFERRDYRVRLAPDHQAVRDALAEQPPSHALVDLKLGNESGLACVETLHRHDPDIRIVVLTSYVSIATAVQAIKLGACHYLAKPANTDDIEAAFDDQAGDAATPLPDHASGSLKTLEWERINQMLAETGFNISETARRLGMHRRTLARKLEKRPVS